MSDNASQRHRRVVTGLLVALPVWLVLSTAIGLWLWNRARQSDRAIEPAKFATAISAGVLEGDLRKLRDVVGGRGCTTPERAEALLRAAAMIEGSLGPLNAGYRVEMSTGPETPNGRFPVIVVELPGGQGGTVMALVAYDSGLGGEELAADSRRLASMLAVASAVAGESPQRPLRFVFLPHGNEAGAPLGGCLDQLADDALLDGVDQVVVVGSEGDRGGAELAGWLERRGAQASWWPVTAEEWPARTRALAAELLRRSR